MMIYEDGSLINMFLKSKQHTLYGKTIDWGENARASSNMMMSYHYMARNDIVTLQNASLTPASPHIYFLECRREWGMGVHLHPLGKWQLSPWLFEMMLLALRNLFQNSKQ